MRIDSLYNAHKGEDVYIVGTGPTMKVFPVDFLRDRLTIGLNQAWKYGPMRYSITVHPELVLEYEAAKKHDTTEWIVKRKPPMADLSYDDPKYIVFDTEQDAYDLLYSRSANTPLFIGKGVQQTAMHLAMHMGCRAIFLVGVDMCALDDEHHGHDQHVRFLGVEPDVVYAEYRKMTAKVRKILRVEWGIDVFTLSPLLGANSALEDYKRLELELGAPKLPKPKDVSPYTRKPPKL